MHLLVPSLPLLARPVQRVAIELTPDVLGSYVGMYPASPDCDQQVLGELPREREVLWLLAHCKLVAGDIDGALEAWHRRDPDGHTQAEALFGEIYSPFNPLAVRERLLTEARSGRASAWVELIASDLAFRQDLWNAPPNEEILAIDLAEARLALVRAPGALADLEGLIAARTGDDAQAMALVRRHRHDLPAEHPTAEAVLVTQQGKTPPGTLLRRYGRGLRKRVEQGDLVALDLLAALVAPTHDPGALADLDKRGCDQGLRTFCLSASFDADPPAGLAERFPHDARFIAIDFAARDAARTESELVRYLVEAPRWMPTSATWNMAFAALATVHAGRPLDTGTLAAAFLLEARPSPACAPWDPDELRASPVCDVAPQGTAP